MTVPMRRRRRATAATTSSVVLPFTLINWVFRVLRSTSVAIALRPASPITKSHAPSGVFFLLRRLVLRRIINFLSSFFTFVTLENTRVVNGCGSDRRRVWILLSDLHE